MTEVICPHGRRLNVFSGVPPEVTTPVTSCFSQYDTFGDPDCQILAVAVTCIFASNCPLQTARFKLPASNCLPDAADPC